MAIVTKVDKGSPLTHNEMDNNLVELDTIPTGKIFPKTKGIGIKIDTDSPEFGWHDIIGTLYQNGTAVFANHIGGIKSLQFSESDDSTIGFHLPHDYLMGSPIYVHVHWSHASALVTGGSVTWAFETTYSKGHNQAAFATPKIISIVQAASLIPYQHMIAEGAMSTTGGSATQLITEDLEVDGLILCRLYLDSNDITTSNASIVNPFAHFVDIHYQSTGVPTKNKAPDFWT